MQRAQNPARTASRDAEAAAAEAVAPLLQLMLSIQTAERLLRHERARELSARALAAAESSQPHDSLVIAAMLGTLICACVRATVDTSLHGNQHEVFGAACRADDQLLALSRRCQALLSARWRAGSLLKPTLEEHAFFRCLQPDKEDANIIGAELYIRGTAEMLCCWPESDSRAEHDARVHHLHDALLALLALARHGSPDAAQSPTAFHFSIDIDIKTAIAANALLAAVFNDAAGDLRSLLRATYGLAQADEAALRHVAPLFKRHSDVCKQKLEDEAAETRASGAADVARHGLRRCALPSCGAQEPHPKLFKLCGRCRGAA
jgi:hypothetical protein